MAEREERRHCRRVMLQSWPPRSGAIEPSSLSDRGLWAAPWWLSCCSVEPTHDLTWREVPWQDIEPTTDDFTYYGDNRRPGKDLHDTPRGGNELLRQLLAASRAGVIERQAVPPSCQTNRDYTGSLGGLLAD